VCTATVVPLEDGFRLAFNRDERRTRPIALPPAIHQIGRNVAVFPLDLDGGGTWIGVNDWGLAAAVLNRTIEAGGSPTRPRSRGLIVPAVLEAQSLDRALSIAGTLSVSQFNLFRLLLAQNARMAVLTSDGGDLSVDEFELTQPRMLTSSSLGDAVVEGPRRRLFTELFSADASAWEKAQAIFHLHRWPERPEVSVLMSRADAKTMSQSFLTISSKSLHFKYTEIAEPIAQVT